MPMAEPAMKPARRPMRRMISDAGIVALVTPAWWIARGSVAQPGSPASIAPISGAVAIMREVPEM